MEKGWTDRLELDSLVLSSILHHSPDCRQKGLHAFLIRLHTTQTGPPVARYMASRGAITAVPLHRSISATTIVMFPNTNIV